MSESPAVKALRDHQQAQSRVKRDRVKSEVIASTDSLDRITVTGIARAAGVSREFIYSHDDLRQMVDSARDVVSRALASRREPPARPDMSSDRASLLALVKKQAEQITEQKRLLSEAAEQRRRWLGDQLAPPIDPEVHLELRISNERMTADAMKLGRRIRELERIVRGLESDLRASREAHTESVRDLTADTAMVTAIDRVPKIDG